MLEKAKKRKGIYVWGMWILFWVCSLFCTVPVRANTRAVTVSGTTVRISGVAYDAAWSWWIYPLISVSPKNGKAYFGYTTAKNVQGVGVYNPNSGNVWKQRLKTKSGKDDHNAVSVSVLPDGRILAAYATGHNIDHYMHVRVSKKPGKVDAWKKEVKLKASARTSYAQVFQYRGRVYLFYRLHDVNSENAEWAWAMRSSKDLKHWTKEKRIVYAKPQYYCLIRPTTKKYLLRIVMTSNPKQNAPEFRQAFLDLRTNTLYQADAKTKVKKLDKTGSHYTRFRIMVGKPGSGKTQRLFDVAVTAPEKLKVAYCVTDRENTTSADYYIYNDGDIREIMTSESAFWRYYFGGISFIDENTILASCCKGGRDRIVLAKLYGTMVRNKWEIASAKAGSKKRMIRPVTSPDGKAAMYQYGTYDNTSFHSFNLDAHMVSISKRGK